MIRFGDAAVVEHMAKFAGVPGLVREAQKKEEKNELLLNLEPLLARHMSKPICPKCGGPTALRTGKLGPFYGCSKYPTCDGIMNIPRATLQTIVESLSIPCPNCSVGKMALRWGKYGPFLGCDRYPEDRTIIPFEKVVDYF